jgi:mRNA interferase HigB
MRIVKEAMLHDVALRHPKAQGWLKTWIAGIRAARWHSFVDLKKMYSTADLVKVSSGRSVVVFNVCGNAFRLIVAVHFNRQIVYTLLFLTHAEYSKNQWKKIL